MSPIPVTVGGAGILTVVLVTARRLLTTPEQRRANTVALLSVAASLLRRVENGQLVQRLEDLADALVQEKTAEARIKIAEADLASTRAAAAARVLAAVDLANAAAEHESGASGAHTRGDPRHLAETAREPRRLVDEHAKERVAQECAARTVADEAEAQLSDALRRLRLHGGTAAIEERAVRRLLNSGGATEAQ